MDSKIPTSFIPKGTIQSEMRTRREPAGILTMIALFLLAASLIYLAGIYAYRYMVYNQINQACPKSGESGNCGLKESLAIETRDLQREKLEQLKRLDTKLKNGSQVLNGHVTLSPFFDLLSQATIQNIQYQKFQFDKTGVTLSGIAKSYEDIAYQQKVFSSDPIAMKKIRQFSFSDFDLDSKGNVTFKLTLSVDPSLLSYMANNSN